MYKYWLGKFEDGKAYLLFGLNPEGAVAELPPHLTPEDVPFIYLNEANEVILDEGSRDAAKRQKEREAQIRIAYAKMDAELLEKSALVFGTSRIDSAMVNYQDWQLMLQYPTYYFNQGLVALIDVYDGQTLIFPKGAPLDSIDKVKTYADKCLQNAVQFSIFRQKRIVQYLIEREAINNG